MNRYSMKFHSTNDSDTFDVITEMENARKHWIVCGGHCKNADVYGDKNNIIEFQLTFTSKYVYVKFKRLPFNEKTY